MTRVYVLLGLLVWSGSQASDTVRVPADVAALVVPVLKAHSAVAKHDTFEAQAAEEFEAQVAEERAMEPLYAHKTAVTNEAIAVLLGFYIGEGPGERLTCEAIARGRVMLPLIKKYKDATVLVLGIDPGQTKPNKTQYSYVVPDIEAGKDCKWEE